jgi:hypothetical protein
VPDSLPNLVRTGSLCGTSCWCFPDETTVSYYDLNSKDSNETPVTLFIDDKDAPAIFNFLSETPEAHGISSWKYPESRAYSIHTKELGDASALVPGMAGFGCFTKIASHNYEALFFDSSAYPEKHYETKYSTNLRTNKSISITSVRLKSSDRRGYILKPKLKFKFKLGTDSQE